jgi:asparagine synthase (glutamine-hydrolysing)
MFALALWDRERRELWLARDRLGEKPLYYGLQGGSLLFASELKSIAAAPGFRGDIDRNAIALLLRRNAVPAPYSIYRGIGKLAPGTWVRVRQRDLESNLLPSPVTYWSPRTAAAARQSSQFQGSPGEAVSALEDLLTEVIGRQMVADVPLGAFLSGGIDSSTVVALMQKQSTRPVKTFTIGFHESGFDEARSAKLVARHLGTDHTELYVSAADAMAIIPQLPHIYCEPFSDSSQIPTVLVSHMARQQVTVSLSGDGGDELFLGYPRYAAAEALKRTVSRLPHWTRHVLASGARHTPSGVITALVGAARAMRPKSRLRDLTPARVLRLAELLTVEAVDGNYREMMTHWPNASDVVLGASDLPTTYDVANWDVELSELPELLGLLDLQAYLPDDILTKVDRAAMATSLETRIPLLDHRVVEFATTLPLSLKWRDGSTKWPLHQVLRRHVPAILTDRPKMGFGVPIAAWLRGPLRHWAEALLSPARLREEGFFDSAPITDKWREHLNGDKDWQHLLWDVLMFQSWLEANHSVTKTVDSITGPLRTVTVADQ